MNQPQNKEGKPCPPSFAAPILPQTEAKTSCVSAENQAQTASANAETSPQTASANAEISPQTATKTSSVPSKTEPQAPPQTPPNPASYTAQYAASAPSLPPTKATMWALLASYPLSFLYIKTWFLQYSDQLGDFRRIVPLFVFCVAFFAGVNALFNALGRPRTRQSNLWLGISAAFFASFAITELVAMAQIGYYGYRQSENWYAMSNIQVLALHAVAAYWVVCRARLCAEDTPGAFTPLDLVDALIAKPFCNFFLRVVHLFRWCSAAFRRCTKGGTKRIWQSVITLCVALPVFAVALSLLMQADANFAESLEKLRFTFTLSVYWSDQLMLFFLSLPVGAYLYGLVGGCAKQEKKSINATRLHQSAEKLRFSPEGSLGIVICGFLALYVAFFALQASYFLSGFGGKLPQGFTAAIYAREGFFQLCAIVVLNFGLLALAAKISQKPLRETRVLKGLSLALMGTNLLFAAVSYSKLYLYISRFGLTLKRVQSAWFTLVLVVFTCIAIATLIKPFAAIQTAIYAGVGLLLVFCISQPVLWADQPAPKANTLQESQQTQSQQTQSATILVAAQPSSALAQGVQVQYLNLGNGGWAKLRLTQKNQ